MKNIKLHIDKKTRYDSITGEKYEEVNTWIRDEKGNHICIMREGKIAEAHLFAASADMYEALVEIRKIVGQIEGKATTQSFEIAEIIARVLKKAKGELTISSPESLSGEETCES